MGSIGRHMIEKDSTYRYEKHNIIIDLQLLQGAQQYPSRSTRDTGQSLSNTRAVELDVLTFSQQ